MTENLEKRRYSVSQSGKFKQKYRQRQQISVEVFHPDTNSEKKTTPTQQRRATYSNYQSFITDHLYNQSQALANKPLEATSKTPDSPAQSPQLTKKESATTTGTIVFEANL